MNSFTRLWAASLATVLVTSPLAGCKTKDAVAEDLHDLMAPAKAAVAPCHDCGTVTAIERVRQKGDASGAGAVLGALTGAVIGHQFGGGRGRDVATVGGAVAGGFAGNEVERNAKAVVLYRVTVALDDGGTRTLEVPDLGGAGVGSKVRVLGDSIELASR